MRLGQLQEVFTKNIAKLILFAESNGFKCRIREIQRTKEQHSENIRTGKTTSKYSPHIDSIAADIYFFTDNNIIFEIDKLSVLGDYWQSLHPLNIWSGYSKKQINIEHFEMKQY